MKRSWFKFKSCNKLEVYVLSEYYFIDIGKVALDKILSILKVIHMSPAFTYLSYVWQEYDKICEYNELRTLGLRRLILRFYQVCDNPSLVH